MNQEKEQKISVAPTINALEVGEKAEFPAERNTVIRSTIATRSIEWHKTFTCRLNREAGVITVTRTA